MGAKSSSFKDVVFGMAAAEAEKTSNPNLLIEGFLDTQGYIDDLLKGNKYLVLGPKGSGKSAIASKLELVSEEKSDLYVKTYFLEDFPYSTFSKLLPSCEPIETRYPANWEFLIFISFLESFNNDSACQFEDSKTYEQLKLTLQELGLFPGKKLNDMVKIVSKKEFKLDLAKIVNISQMSEKQKVDHGMDRLFKISKEVCFSIRTDAKHIIVIDGLDDVLTKRNKQYESLSALILSADRINRQFQTNHIDAKIVVLCRTDLFEKLPGSNNNKIKQDYGILLDWYQDVKDVCSTNLVKLINLRAKTSLKRDVDVFEEFLPPDLFHNEKTAKILLDNTRYRPRDFIQLFNNIQEHTKGNAPTKDEILSGIRTYSLTYFIDEIRDELSGYLEYEEINHSIMLLSAMKMNRFKLDLIEHKKDTDDRFKSLDLTKILHALFDCSAIGNVRENYGDYLYTYKFRNPYAIFDPNDFIITHRGISKALNIK